MQPSDSLLWTTIAAIVVAAIAGGAIFIVRAFRGEAQPTADPLERIVADLFRSAAPPIPAERLAPVIDLADTRTARMRAMLADLAEVEATRAGHAGTARGAHRAR